MRKSTPPGTSLLLVFVLALIPRFIGALWLPNAFGDAYAYTEQIYYLRRALLNGSFSPSNLFGFWLPLYQLICACISAIIGSPFYVPKLVSAFGGAGVCVLVSLLTYDLTQRRRLSFAAAAIVALNPYHIFYSSSAMTDVPHAFFILLCAYCCIRGRWLLASLCGLAAGLMRIESWILIPLIPLAQYLTYSQSTIGSSNGLVSSYRRSLWQRFFGPIIGALVLAAGPCFWLFVSWKASGSFGRYFEIRNNYIVETLAANPWLASFSIPRVAFDFLRLLYTAHPLVMYAAIVVLAIVIRTSGNAGAPVATKRPGPLRILLQTGEGLLLTFFFSHLIFLLLAYFTNNQPEIWPRYGLLFFTLGVPLLASLASKRMSQTHDCELQTLTDYLRKGAATVYVTAAFFAVQFCVQLIDVTRITVKSDPNAVTAEFLGHQQQADPSTRIYCEDGAIRVLSGIPLEEFKDQYNSPAADDDAFLASLRSNQIRFLVYKELPGSRLRGIIARLRTRTRSTGITLEEINPKPAKNAKDVVVVYRIHDRELAKTERRSPATRYRRQ